MVFNLIHTKYVDAGYIEVQLSCLVGERYEIFIGKTDHGNDRMIRQQRDMECLDRNERNLLLNVDHMKQQAFLLRIVEQGELDEVWSRGAEGALAVIEGSDKP